MTIFDDYKPDEPNLDNMEYVMCCPLCYGTTTNIFTVNDYWRWRINGELIQDVFPNSSADEREMMMTGLHPECWKQALRGEGQS